MRAVLQRVASASVAVDGEVLGSIGHGVLVLLAVAPHDSVRHAEWLAGKVTRLRIFPDDAGKMNLSVFDVGGSVLVVSQFTLFGDCRKGNRPSFALSAAPEDASRLYEVFVDAVAAAGAPVQRGRFGAMMDVALVNSGPVTLVVDTPELL